MNLDSWTPRRHLALLFLLHNLGTLSCIPISSLSFNLKIGYSCLQHETTPASVSQGIMSDIDSRQCYWPNGEKATGAVPCTSDETTHCCGTHDICLTNGYCLDIVQPFVASRGGCTSSNWGTGCPSQCQDVTPHEGASIINLKFTKGVSTYCCGTPIVSGDSTACPSGSPFELDSGQMIVGRAGLSNLTNKTDTATSNATTLPTSTSTPKSSPSNGNKDVAIGVGVGVPLGLIALLSIIWALWERRRAHKISHAFPHERPLETISATGLMNRSKGTPTELDSRPPPSELMSSESSNRVGSNY